MEKLSIYEYLEDFDNEELSESERKDQLKEAILDYNEKYDTRLNTSVILRNYESWKRSKFAEDR